MGLLDVLNGMENGPRGASAPGSGSGGMSPLKMALLGLIAYKAIRSFGGSSQPSAAGSGAADAGTAAPPGANEGLLGGLGNLLRGGLGSLLGGGAAGSQPNAADVGAADAGAATPASGGLGDLSKGGLGALLGGSAGGGVLSGGLNDLLKQFEQSGKGDVAQSWVGSGPNKAISPEDLANTLGAERINTLTSYSGLSREELLHGLSQQLPELVDRLTPQGRVPTEQEAARLL